MLGEVVPGIRSDERFEEMAGRVLESARTAPARLRKTTWRAAERLGYLRSESEI